MAAFVRIVVVEALVMWPVASAEGVVDKTATSGLADADLKDIDILISIGVFWLLFFLAILFYRRSRMVRNKGGIVVRLKDIEDAFKTPFIYDLNTMHHRVRSYEHFVDRTGEPPEPSMSFQVLYSTSRRMDMYKLVPKGALKSCVRFTLINGALAIMLSWWSRNCDIVAAKLKTSYFDSAAVSSNMEAAFQVQQILLPLASFILALYTNMKLDWFNKIISISWSLQGKIADLALVLPSTASPPNDPAVTAAKFQLYRYLNVLHFLTYQPLAVLYSKVTVDDLARCGLLTEDERDILANSTSTTSAVMVWIGATYRDVVAGNRMPEEMLHRVFEILRETRDFVDKLSKELTRVAPISYAQLMQLLVDGLLLLSPASLSHVLRSTHEGFSVYLWPATGSMLLAMFYQGSMQLVSALEYPLGSDLDDLQPDWLLMSTERATWSLLTSGYPEQLAEGSVCLRNKLLVNAQPTPDKLTKAV